MQVPHTHRVDDVVRDLGTPAPLVFELLESLKDVCLSSDEPQTGTDPLSAVRESGAGAEVSHATAAPDGGEEAEVEVPFDYEEFRRQQAALSKKKRAQKNGESGDADGEASLSALLQQYAPFLQYKQAPPAANADREALLSLRAAPGKAHTKFSLRQESAGSRSASRPRPCSE